MLQIKEKSNCKIVIIIVNKPLIKEGTKSNYIMILLLDPKKIDDQAKYSNLYHIYMIEAPHQDHMSTSHRIFSKGNIYPHTTAGNTDFSLSKKRFSVDTVPKGSV